MIIIERYIFKSFIYTFLSCVFILWIIYIIGDIFGFLDEILRERIPFTSLAAFYMYLTPFIIGQTMPISTLIACVFILGNLNRQNEITALRASGIGVWSILRPMLVAAFIVSLFMFVVNDKLLPPAMQMANRIRYEKLDIGKRGSSQSVKIKGVALWGSGNRIVYAEKFDIKNNVLEGVIVHQQDKDQNLILRIDAKKANWVDDKWVAEDVIMFEMNNRGEFISDPIVKNELPLEITETPTDFVNEHSKPENMSYAQLRKYIKIFATGSSRTYRRFSVDLNNKIAFPFACIVTILISAPFALSSKRGGALIGMATGILVAILYIPVMGIVLALGKGGTFPPLFAAWFTNFLFGGAGIYFLSKY